MIDTDYWISQIDNNISEITKILLIAIIFIIAVVYLILRGNRQVVIDNWSQYRCNPFIMPFADFYGKPSNENFQSCLWIMVEKYAKFLLQPFHYINTLTFKVLQGFGGSINEIRKMMLQTRYFFLSIVSNVMNRLYSLMGNMQYFIVKLRYTLQKMHGVMITILYSSFTGTQTMSSTWNGPIGGFARFFCFHPDTLVTLCNFDYKKISDIKLNDIMFAGEKVIGIQKFKYTNDIQLINYNNTIVSGDHIVFDKDTQTWKKVKELDKSKYQLVKSNLPEYLYNVITEKHILISNNNFYTDYIETSNPIIHKYTKKLTLGGLNNSYNIDTDTLTDSFIIGLSQNTTVILNNGATKSIQNIEISDILEDNNKILGVIKQIKTSKTIMYEFNNVIMSEGTILYYQNKWETIECVPESIKLHNDTTDIVYNLVTESGELKINNVRIRDYTEITNKGINDMIDNLVLQDLNKNNYH
jgi:hypothetical protein